MKKQGYKYLEFISVLYVASLIIANTIAVKIIDIGGLSIPAGILCFPMTYIINDVLTEIYGFDNAKRVIKYGFICLALMVFLYSAATVMPSASIWRHQKEFEYVFTLVPRIALGSLVAYIFGSLLNSYYMVIIKTFTKGNYLWIRTIGSTIIGEGVDSFIFNIIAFYGIFKNNDLLIIILTGWSMKTVYEVLATPFTYLVVGYLRRNEIIYNEDGEK